MFKYILIDTTVQMLVDQDDIAMGGGVTFVFLDQILVIVELTCLFMWELSYCLLDVICTNNIHIIQYIASLYKEYDRFYDKTEIGIQYLHLELYKKSLKYHLSLSNHAICSFVTSRDMHKCTKS